MRHMTFIAYSGWPKKVVATIAPYIYTVDAHFLRHDDNLLLFEVKSLQT